MNTFAIKLGSVVALVLLTLPTGAHAYRFVESSAQYISGTTYLLTHTYTAGFLNEDMQTPIVATSDYTTEGDYQRVGFSVETTNSALAGAEVNAIVLSDTAISNSKYLTTAGARDTFTLVALVTLPNMVSSADDLSLQVRTLPFSYTQDGEEKTGWYDLTRAAQSDEMVLTTGN